MSSIKAHAPSLQPPSLPSSDFSTFAPNSVSEEADGVAISGKLSGVETIVFANQDGDVKTNHQLPSGARSESRSLTKEEIGALAKAIDATLAHSPSTLSEDDIESMLYFRDLI